MKNKSHEFRFSMLAVISVLLSMTFTATVVQAQMPGLPPPPELPVPDGQSSDDASSVEDPGDPPPLDGLPEIGDLPPPPPIAPPPVDNVTQAICSTPLTTWADAPNWKHQYRITDADDFVWQRSTLNKPVDELVVREGINSTIEGYALPGAPVQIYLFTATYDAFGNLIAPSEQGTCLRTEADSTGFFRASVSPQILWPLVGTDEFVVDAFTKLHSDSQNNNNSTNGNFQIGTNVPIKIVRVVGENNSGSNNEDGGCPIACEESGVIAGVKMDSGTFSKDIRYLNPSFDPIGHKPVTVGRTPGEHSFYTRIEIDGYEPTMDELGTLRYISLKAVLMEAVKRALLGELDTTGTNHKPLSSLSAVEMESAIQTGGGYSQSVQVLLQTIKKLMLEETDTGKRNELGKEIFETIKVVSTFNFEINELSVLPGELFPHGVGTETTWSSDLVELLVFWSGDAGVNTCLATDNKLIKRNFQHSSLSDRSLGRFNSNRGDLCGFNFVHGVDPAIILFRDDEVVLAPHFNGAKIVHSDRAFDRDQAWVFPAGKDEKVLQYAYQFDGSTNLDSEINQSCVSTADIPEYIAQLTESFELIPAEQALLKNELDILIPKGSKLHRLSLMHPETIGNHFHWLANGEELNSLQLFFRSTPNVCISKSIPEISPEVISELAEQIENRDAFESGIIH